MRIAIDIGHGSKPYDTGAIGILKEEAVTDDIAAKLIPLLKLRGHQIVECRPVSCQNENDSLDKRIDSCNSNDCDLYISLHCNKFLDGSKTTDRPMGVETFAIGQRSQQYAQLVQNSLVGLGFIDRKVKDGLGIKVLKNTNCPAILIEFFFLDSIADIALFKKLGATALAEAVADGVSLSSAKSPEKVGSGIKTIGDLIADAEGSTAPLAKINQELVAEAQKMGAGIKMLLPNDKFKAADAACCLALNSDIIASFQVVAAQYFAKYQKPLVINSCYRTALQQIILHEWCQRGLCGIEAAARPGTSNHEGGNAIDVSDYDGAKAFFKGQGWAWQHDISGNDPYHFEKGRSKKVGLLALQKYYNRQQPGNAIEEDGIYGPQCRQAILEMQIS